MSTWGGLPLPCLRQARRAWLLCFEADGVLAASAGLRGLEGGGSQGRARGRGWIQLPGHRAPRALLSPIELKSQAGLGCPEGRGSEHGQAEVDTPNPREQGEPLCPLQPALYT